MQLRLILSVIIGTLSLFGCGKDKLPQPMCRTMLNTLPHNTASAACLIKLDGRLLTIKHKASGKLDLPGGHAAGDRSSQCVAHRQTWQATGFNVKVGTLLGRDSNGFSFYACTLHAGFDGSVSEFPVPPWAYNEVTQVALIDPFEITIHDWQDPDQLTTIREMFTHWH